MSQKQQFMSQKQYNQATQNQQQQFRNPIFLSKQTKEKTMENKQQTTLQKQQNQETQNQQQQFRNPIFLSKQSQTQEQTMKNQHQMSQKQQQTTLQKQQSQGTQNQQFRKPTWRPNEYSRSHRSNRRKVICWMMDGCESGNDMMH